MNMSVDPGPGSLTVACEATPHVARGVSLMVAGLGPATLTRRAS